MKSTITYAYQAKCYDLSKMFGTYKQTRMLDEDKVYYDIKIRNDFMQKQHGGGSSSDDDDFDDLF